jgi:hypothetical protein
LGIGFVLHSLVPAIDVGMGTLMGVMTLGLSFQWLSHVSTLSALYAEETEVLDAPWPHMPFVNAVGGIRRTIRMVCLSYYSSRTAPHMFTSFREGQVIGVDIAGHAL